MIALLKCWTSLGMEASKTALFPLTTRTKSEGTRHRLERPAHSLGVSNPIKPGGNSPLPTANQSLFPLTFRL